MLDFEPVEDLNNISVQIEYISESRKAVIYTSINKVSRTCVVSESHKKKSDNVPFSYNISIQYFNRERKAVNFLSRYNLYVQRKYVSDVRKAENSNAL